MADVLPLIQVALGSLSLGHLPPTDVLKTLISKMMGYGIIAGSTLVKVPQISNVVRAHSAEGLSATAFELESWGLLVHASYGYINQLPFSSYGEAAILLTQNLLLLALVYKYARLPAIRVAAVASIIVGAIAVLASGNVTRSHVGALYDVNNFIMLAARVPQILKSYGDKSTGQLSIITFGVNTVGCVARIFTTLHEGGGPAMLRAYILSLVLNATLVGQILLYGNKGVRQEPASKAAKTKKKA